MGLARMWANRKKVLGMNERNLTYIKRYNRHQAKLIADDKLLTKKILAKAEIPSPKLVGHIRDFQELQDFNWDILPKSFVMKPVHGLEGGGIEIFFNRDKNGDWIKADGSKYSLAAIQSLAAEIIDGKYSLHGDADQVFFEERVRVHKVFKYYSYKGVPDVRVIVFNHIPVMSYVRLPTKESDGKGNLAQGAIGAAIDMTSGVTTHAVRGKAEIIERIPGTSLSVSGLKIPYWERILRYAVEAQKATDLGFMAADFLIDRDQGPMIVELNARPGLSIQISNQDGLRWRLRKAKGIKVQSAGKGVRVAKDLFGGEVEEDIERISGKSVIGLYEDVYLYSLVADSFGDEKAKEIKTKAKIDTGADSSSIDRNLAIELGYQHYIEYFEKLVEERQLDNEKIEALTLSEADKLTDEMNDTIISQNFPIKMHVATVRSSHGRSLRLYLEFDIQLGDFRFQTMVNIYNRSKMTYKMIVGRKSMAKFLVEPSKNKV
jgi:alpha-L-glutamate ligase-like protein